jgi:hypothetical protein
MKEIWKDINGYEGMYQISNLGRVKSLARIVERQNNHDLFVRERILTNGTYLNGYKYARLHRGGQTKNELIHRLVASAFIENKENLPFVNHKDETKDNNVINNLEWCTREYNMNYGTCRARIKKNVDLIKRGNAIKKPIKQLDADGNIIKNWDSSFDAETHFAGKFTGNISKCLRGRQEKSYGYKWQYAEVM